MLSPYCSLSKGYVNWSLITETVKRVTKHVTCKEILDHGPFSPLHPLQCKSKSLLYIGLWGRILFHWNMLNDILVLKNKTMLHGC